MPRGKVTMIPWASLNWERSNQSIASDLGVKPHHAAKMRRRYAQETYSRWDQRSKNGSKKQKSQGDKV